MKKEPYSFLLILIVVADKTNYADVTLMQSGDLLAKITPICSYDELQDILQVRSKDTAYAIAFCNAHAFNIARKNAAFLKSLLEMDILLRDGIGMKAAFWIFSLPPGINANGTDLIPAILKNLPGRRIAIYGTRNPWLQKAADAVRDFGLDVCDLLDGYQPDEVYLRSIQLNKPEVVLLGMGMPRQEEITSLLKCRSDFPLLIINGGAILDFLGKRFPRAPSWMRRAGLEWVFRLLLEPRRLFRRYVLGNAEFISRIVLFKIAEQQIAARKASV